MSEKRNIEMAEKIAVRVKEKGGSAYFVGGFVRDRLQGKENKDIDIEVHKVTPAEIEEILDSLGKKIETGKSFGVYNLRCYDIDIALPRCEQPLGKGHKDFKIDVDPFIGTMKAASRRDFTVNAIMQDILSGEIIDHFGGVKDLKSGILRHVDDSKFPEDPLRVLRGAQFSARFGFEIAPETLALCRRIPLDSLSRERVFEEMKKALLKAEKPSRFFENLRNMNQLSLWFEKIENLAEIPQHSVHHREGNVWNHTMMVRDEAAKCRNEASFPLHFMISALIHDLGKAVCTEFIKGDYHAYGHETAGEAEVKAFLCKLTDEKNLIRYALNMTRLHMKPNTFAHDKSCVKATNKLFDESVCPGDLILLSLCDGCGKIPPKPRAENEAFLKERLAVYKEYMERPFVTGEDLIKAGIAPGKEMSELLKFAHKLRLAGVSKENVLREIIGIS